MWKTIGKLMLALGFLLAALGLAFHAVRAKNQAEASGPVTLYLETPLSAKEPQAFHEAADGMAFTAWELFGSTQVTGDGICIGNETRVIRGVVNLPQSGVMLGGSVKGMTEIKTEDDGGVYDRITVGGGKAEDAEMFLVQNGLDGKILRLDYLRSLRWLTELIPGKWSDFTGWKDSFTQKKEDFGLLFQINKNSIELYFMHQCFLYIRDMVLEAVCVAGALCTACVHSKALKYIVSLQRRTRKIPSENKK